MPNKNKRYGLPQTKVRGTKLLRKVMDQINAEAKDRGIDVDDSESELAATATVAGAWDQGSWITISETRELQARLVAKAMGQARTIVRTYDDGSASDVYTTVPQGLLVSCDSASCFAGHTTLMAGDTPIIVGDKVDLSYDITDNSLSPDYVWGDDGRWEIADRARELLGLSHVMSKALFYPNNDLAQLNRLVDAICDGVDEVTILREIAYVGSTDW